MNKELLEKQYREITSLYDMAEELATTVESDFSKNPEEQLALVEPLIDQVAESTDILAEEFITVLEHPAKGKSAKSRIESALRKIFTALEEYRKKAGAGNQKLLSALANIADPIVDKIRKQVDKIILVFMQHIQLSLDRVMQKFELEEFKRIHDKAVGNMLQLGH